MMISLRSCLKWQKKEGAAMDKTIALYMRLSDEDDNLAAHEESNSISIREIDARSYSEAA